MQATQSFARYLHYIGGMASPPWHLAGRDGAVLGDDLVDLCDCDAVICLAPRPCAKATIQVANLGRERGALIVGSTDSRVSPRAAVSDRLLLAPDESPSFFESYISTVAIIEMLVGSCALGAGDAAINRIDRIEEDRRLLGEYWEVDTGQPPGVSPDTALRSAVERGSTPLIGELLYRGLTRIRQCATERHSCRASWRPSTPSRPHTLSCVVSR